jgi:hypothetical protein
MRHPFYMDHLDPQEQRTVRRLYIRVVVFYCWLALFTVAMVSLRIVLDPHIDAVVQASQLVGPSSAIAAEPSHRARCAARDLKIVLLIEAHGEAQDVPAEELRQAFFTMAEARAACAAGRTDEALAIYDGISIVPTQSARK